MNGKTADEHCEFMKDILSIIVVQKKVKDVVSIDIIGKFKKYTRRSV